MVSLRRRTAAGTTTTRTTSITITAAAAAVSTGSKLDRAEIDAANNAELRTNAQNILSTIHTYRPKNTKKTYDPKQRDFKVRKPIE
jgi:hypothetical protein